MNKFLVFLSFLAFISFEGLAKQSNNSKLADEAEYVSFELQANSHSTIVIQQKEASVRSIQGNTEDDQSIFLSIARGALGMFVRMRHAIDYNISKRCKTRRRQRSEPCQHLPSVPHLFKFYRCNYA